MQKVVKVTNKRYRLNYHVSTPAGWMNDPNGFSYFRGYYHIFYQYYPYSVKKGPMHWGHYRSKDLVHWEELPIALAPTDDKNVCFSGSAIEKDNRLYLFYTGHQYFDLSDHTKFRETQNMAYSDDGIHFIKYKYNPIIAKPPEDNTQDFRDPKIWQHDQYYYMILGSQSIYSLGRAIVYRSKDLFVWNYLGSLVNSRIAEKEGFMWECPDLFSLQDKDVFLCSPQGIESDGLKFLNKFQTGYFVGQMDYEKNIFIRSSFTELDHGHDFYAAQTMLSPDGRRLLIGWMGMWDADFPEQEDGWAGALTLPRELNLKNDHIFMNPVAELMSLRTEKVADETLSIKYREIVASDTQHIELLFKASIANWLGEKISFTIESHGQYLVSLTWSKKESKVVVERSDKPVSDSKRYGKLKTSDVLKMHIFIDTSSIEFFLNDGELVFSERYYTEEQPQIFLSADRTINMKIEGYILGT